MATNKLTPEKLAKLEKLLASFETSTYTRFDVLTNAVESQDVTFAFETGESFGAAALAEQVRALLK
jgi:hypothetical protein